MNKTELISAIAEGAGLSKADAKKALDVTLSTIANAMKEGDKVALVGFGTLPSRSAPPAKASIPPPRPRSKFPPRK